MSELVSVHMACNHPDNGDFVGRVCQIALANDALNLTARAWDVASFRRCPKLQTVAHSAIILSGKRWPIKMWKPWLGNWCWNGYAMSSEIATDFLIWLHSRKLFNCENGWQELYEAWHSFEPLKLGEKWWKV